MSVFSLSKIIRLLEKANDQDVNISFLEDELSVHVQKGKQIDRSLLDELKMNKPFLIHYFKNFANKENTADLTPIKRIDKNELTRIPLSFAQERLWFIHQLEGSVQYHLPIVLRLKGHLVNAALVHAFQSIFNRHEVLRTVVREEDGRGYQHIKGKDGWDLEIVNGFVYKDDPEGLQRYIRQLIIAPFDLSRDDMLRAVLINIGSEEHVLVVTLHHIASDAWSQSILVKEFVEFYSAYLEGRDEHLPVIGIQYADYANWQRNYLREEILDKKLDYWKNKLDGFETLLLPADHVRSLVQSGKGNSIGFTTGKEISDQLYRLGQKQGTTLFMTLLSVFKVLLYRYSGQRDITVGTSIASRPRKELEGMIGFFVNTLALRDEVNAGDSFDDLLQQVKITTLGAFEHQDIPFEKVVETVVKERDMSQSPLFRVMLVLANTPEVSKLSLGELELSNEGYKQSTSKFDITFFITETVEGLQGLVQYSTDLYEEDTIRRMTDHFGMLLRSVVKDPHQKVGLLSMISEAEQRQLLEGSNVGEVSYPFDKSVVALFEEQVIRAPFQTALVFEGQSLTYGELNERSNQLAHYLRGRGVQPGSLIPLYVERSVAMMTGMLGIMKAGAVYVPIDTDFPAGRISYMIRDTGAAIIVSSAASSAGLEVEAGVEIVKVDSDISGQPTGNVPEKPLPGHLAYVIYTSGSTGTPKGVMIEHRSLVDYYYGLNKYTAIGESRSFALVSTIATDLGNTVIYASLLSGGALHIFSKESVSNIEYLGSYFTSNRIDCLKIVPSHWKALSRQGSLLLPEKLLVFGGETLQPEVLESIRLSGSGCRVVNHYGPTETTIGKLLHEVNEERRYDKAIPVGRPFSNTRVYVLSKELQLCPVGIPGQLYIGGDGLARGYWNNEEMTRQKFIGDPFVKDQARMYGSGDLVRWQSDGDIAFIGRVDDQVKIRGYRVEPSEVRGVLYKSGLVREAVVVAGEDKKGAQRLVAYIVPVEEYDREELLRYLKEQLADYMVPAVMMEMEGLPLTANGKVDRKSLPDPEEEGPSGEQYVAPRDETEAKMAGIWQEVLEVDQVSMDADFFELGGHSLLAVRLVSAIRKAFAVEMPIGDIFDYPTVALLSKQVTKPTQAVMLPTIKAVNPRPARIPLSFSQERLWFIDKLDGSRQYHVPAVLRLKGKLHKEVLSNAFQQIINRHEVLRTVILEEEGTGYQFIKEKDGWQLQYVDGSMYRNNAEGLEQYIKEFIDLRFNLAEDYVVRAALVSLDEEDHVLAVINHHIASDGWSNSIVVKELAELYNAWLEKRAVLLDPLPVQYADYAIWQHNNLKGEEWDRKLEYWKGKLEGVAALQLSTDYQRPLIQSTNGAVAGFKIDYALLAQLRALSQEQGTTLFMTMLAAFKVLLYRYSGQHDICVGTPIAGRQQQELEGLIGFFINTLALRSNLIGTDSFKDLLKQVKATTLEAFNNQDVPFEKVVELVVKERDISRSPLFQAMFIMQNAPETQELHLGNVRLYQEVTGSKVHHTSKFELTFVITETEQGLYLSVEYCTDLFNEPTVKRIMAHYDNLLHSLIKNPGQGIGLLPMLNNPEVHQLLELFNDTEVRYPLKASLTALFEEQVLKTPESIALIFGDTQISYHQLNERSNEMAHYLRSRGVQPGSLVPLCIERCMEMIIGMVGILKAGATYVPIDADYPEERILYILEDTGSDFIVTNTNFAVSFALSKNFELICADRLTVASQPLPNLAYDYSPDQLVCIIYTSGSTGKPKGVKLTNEGIVNRLYWMWNTYPFDPEEINAIKTSIGFGDHICELFGALNRGITSVIFKKDELLDLDVLIKKLTAEKISRWVLVPSLLTTLLSKLQDDGMALPHLRYWTSSGETLPLDVANNFYKVFPSGQHKLLNIYGSSEVTADVSCYDTSVYDFDNKSNRPGRFLPIGKPISNCKIYIIDENQQLVAMGVMGEICIAGLPVGKGYLNLPELTSKRFVRDPFSGKQDGVMFKSGDYGRWLPDGNIEYLGRIDDQVKIRGNRVELGEIENVLKQGGLLQHCVILAKDDKAGNKNLVSYIVAKGAFDKELISAGLKEKLPDYMIPSIWVQLESLPLTSSGKIDKKALANLDLSDLQNNAYVGPRNMIEAKLVDIWRKLLMIERVGIYDNFFEMGGHSLLAMRLVSAMRKEIEVEITIKSLFTHATIAELAAHLVTQSPALSMPPLEAQERPEYIPLSFGQERLWFIDQLGGSIPYHISAILRLIGALDSFVLEDVLQQIINRHEVLRTVIMETEGIAHQFVKGKDSWQLQHVDGSRYKNDIAGLQQYVQRQIEFPFNLATDYMLRAELITLEEEDNVFVISVHHIASDGWSVSVIVKELVELYNATLEKRTALLAPLPVQFADYAIWQRKYLQGEAWDRKLEYWRNKLEGVAVLQLLTDYPRPLVQSVSGAITGFTIEKKISDQLQAISQQHGATMFMTLLAAFNVLLYRYSGQQDICVGTPIAGRQQHELETLIGFFVNTLALRTSLIGSASFTELLQQVRNTTLEAYENQEVPFEKVVELVVKERDMSRGPLFQVMLVLQNTPEIKELHLGELQVSRGLEGPSAHHTAKFDITFIITETVQGLHVSIEYCTDLFNEPSIQRMMAHFNELLHSIVKDAGQSIALLSMVTESEKRQLLVDFNNTAFNYPVTGTIVDLFEELALKHPRNIALTCNDERFTYTEMNERANQLAYYLQKKGVVKDMMVAICMERSAVMIIGIVAILKAGGVYVPIDPRYPQERIDFMLADIGAQLMLVSKESRQELPFLDGVDMIELGKDWALTGNNAIGNLHVEIQPGNLAYVIYTSGSTGKPKGVMVTHNNVVSLVKGVDYISLSVDDVLLSTGSSSFDATTFEYWGMLLNGGQLVLCSENTLLDNNLLKNEIVNRKVNRMWFTSSWFNQLVETDITLFEKLQTIVVGGEKLSEHHIEKLRQVYPFIQIINGYGPTENTTFSLTYDVTETIINKPIPVGRPLNNRTAFILDEHQQLVPIGVGGEICLAGDGLSRGYLNEDELTAEKFIDHPFSNSEKAKMYRTGDIGRWLPDGNIEYLGRKDSQVKIRGYRVELGEIEHVIQQTGLVSQNVVIVKEDDKGIKRLAAYFVPITEVDKEDIREHIMTKLPEYMVPAIWVPLEKLPLTANGKIDKGSLPSFDAGKLLTNKFIEPETELERNFAAIWRSLLGIERVGIHDNFFELGGDSILTMQVVNQAKRLGYELQVKDMFVYQTIAELCIAITQRQTTAGSGEQGYLTGECGLLPIQQWYLQNARGDVSYFNQSVLLGIDKAISPEILGVVLEQLIAHHDALRFKYYQKGGEWTQEYGNYPYTLLIEDLCKVTNDEVEKIITAKAGGYQQKLDIREGNLMQAVLMRTPDTVKQNRLLIVIHHLAVDGVSWRIIIENIEFQLTGLQVNRKAALGIKSSSYRQWYEALKQYGALPSVLSQLHYWKNISGRYRPSIMEKNLHESILLKDIGRQTSTLGIDKTRQLLHQVPKAYNTEINDILLCALTMAFCNWNKSDEVVIGLEGHGREEIADDIDTSRTVGWFTNLYPVLIELGTPANTADTITSVKTQLRQIPDKGLGFGVLKYLNKIKELEGKTGWNIVFNYLGQLDNVIQTGKWLSVAGESAGQRMGEDNVLNERLSLTAFVQGGQLVLSWNYDKRNYEKEVIINLIDDYLANLVLLIDHCTERQHYGVIQNFKEGNPKQPMVVGKMETGLRNNNYLIPIKTAGKKIPLYIITGGGATANKFMKFAKMLDPNQPVYVLQPPIDSKNLEGFPDSIGKIAQVFIKEVLAANPKGPYALSGHCTGGLIAYEMARQLKLMGKKIHLLAVFDTVAWKKEIYQTANFNNLYNIPAFVKKFISKTILKLEFEIFIWKKHTKHAIEYKLDSFKSLTEKFKKMNHGNKFEYVGMEIFYETSDIYTAAHSNYEILPYDGDIIVFYAKERYYFTDADNNIRYKKVFLSDKMKNMWREFATGVTIYEVEGDHSEMFETSLGDTFAKTLQYQLDNAGK